MGLSVLALEFSACAVDPAFFPVQLTPVDPTLNAGKPVDPPLNASKLSSLLCKSPALVLKSGQSANIQFDQTPDNSAPSYSLRTSSGAGPDLGSLVPANTAPGRSITYLAPAAIPNALSVSIVATSNDVPALAASCTVNLVADSTIGIVDDGKSKGLVGNVYALPSGTLPLPPSATLDGMTPVQTLLVPNLDYPKRAYVAPFPGVSLAAWYAIAFEGKIVIEKDGMYQFQILSDDGSALIIDGKEVIDLRDHRVPQLESAPISLAMGNHTIRIDYNQQNGPNLALQLGWSMANNGVFGPYMIIPPSNFLRP